MKRINWYTGTVMLMLLTGSGSMVCGQSSILEEYIRTGLENNMTVRKTYLSYEKNLAALSEAKGYFLPGLSFNARYTVARGGRTFEFPAGDMLNPLLQNITALNSAMAGINPMYPVIPSYPSVDNISFRFYRPSEHETKLSLVQPIFNPAIYYNYKIKKREAEMGIQGIEISRRTVVKQITDTYYDYLRAYGFDQLAGELIRLATENARVCNSLFNNNMITRDILSKAESDLASAKMKKAETNGAVNSAAALFNFHLNRNLEEPILRDTSVIITHPVVDLDESMEVSAEKRPETSLMDSWLEANRLFIKLTSSEALPVVAGAADYGFQGEEYRFGSEDDFVLASVALRWNISSGRTNRNKIRQAMIDREVLEVNREELVKQIELQVLTSYYSLLSAHEAAEAAAAALEPAGEAYTVAKARFREGQESYAGLLESQTMLMKAREEMLDRQYRFMKEKTAFSLATGNMTIK